MEACSGAVAAHLPLSFAKESISPIAQPSLQFNWSLFANRVIDWQVRSRIRQTRHTEQTRQSIKKSFPSRAWGWQLGGHTHTTKHTHSVANCLFSCITFSALIVRTKRSIFKIHFLRLKLATWQEFLNFKKYVHVLPNKRFPLISKIHKKLRSAAGWVYMKSTSHLYTCLRTKWQKWLFISIASLC